MKVDSISHEKNRVDVRRNFIRHVLNWGKDNDYPQSVMDIVNGSYTGVSCLDIYHKFIYGHGFADADNYQIIVNEDGENADALLEKVSHDLAQFGGFAIHLNRNLLGQITSMRHIPLENIRKCIKDNKEHRNQVALHPDWGGRTDRRFTDTPVEYINLYDPNLDTFLDRVHRVGGIFEYRGEIYYFSNRGEDYPLPIYDACLTDMATQEAISNIAYKNSRHGFLPSGCFVEINEFYDDENPSDKDAFDAVTERLKELQGDKATSSILHVVAKDKDSIPSFVSMKGENYDKEFSVSRDSAKQNIGQAFRQPEELRCEKTASGFSNDSMIQAYRVYNSMTSKERYILEQQFAHLFKNWHQPLEYNFQIKPLSYGAESLQAMLGESSSKDIIDVVKDESLAKEQKKSILMLIYGLAEDEANQLLLIKEEEMV